MVRKHLQEMAETLLEPKLRVVEYLPNCTVQDHHMKVHYAAVNMTKKVTEKRALADKSIRQKQQQTTSVNTQYSKFNISQ